MTLLSELLKTRRSNLVSDIKLISTNKLHHIDALELCDQFISSATNEAAYGDSFSFFGRMRSAGESLPEQFEHLDDRSTIKDADRRVQPYIRSQLFIALIAELEDFLSQILIKVLEAYPVKIREQNLSLKQILELGTLEAVITQAATVEMVRLFYAGPREYRKRIESILSVDPASLNSLWPLFTEMKARRDVGLHNQWQHNRIYEDKVTEAGGAATTAVFLGVDRAYFKDSLSTARALVETLRSHCQSKFGNGDL